MLRLGNQVAAARELCSALTTMHERGEPYYESMVLAFAAQMLARRDPAFAVRVLALIDRMREEAVFVGAARDLEVQQKLRARLEAGLAPEQFAELWEEGRASTLDDMIAVAFDELAMVAESEEPTGAR